MANQYTTDYERFYDEWVELYESGWSLVRIANKYSCSQSAVTTGLKKCGVKIGSRDFAEHDGRPPIPWRERFQQHFKRGDPEDCWEWEGARDSHGYGSLRADGKATGAHRLSWRYHRGKIPEGLYVLHKCHNRPCVNPSHLKLGTQKDNMRDLVKKRRKQWENS